VKVICSYEKRGRVNKKFEALVKGRGEEKVKKKLETGLRK